MPEICDRCDMEMPVGLCPDCKGEFCEDCTPKHRCEPVEEDED